MTEMTLTNPIISVTWNVSNWSRIQIHTIIAIWLGASAAMAIGAIYLYAIIYAGWVGYETAVLTGIAIVALSIWSDSDD